MRRNRKTAQQEMVGFVLIVVLVVVALMIFLLIRLNKVPVELNSLEVDNFLEAIMSYTTKCAPNFEPQYDTFEELFKDCHRGRICKNLYLDSCEYLNESLKNVVESLISSEASVSAYRVDFLSRGNGLETGILRIEEGECKGVISSAQKVIISGSESLIVRASFCRY